MCVITLLGFLTLGATRAEDAEPTVITGSAAPQVAAVPDTTVRVWLDQKSQHAPVALPVDRASRTELVFGKMSDFGLEPFPKGAAPATDELFDQACANAAADLKTLKPRYVRDKQKVIQYAELRSDQPIVASAVLAPKFLSLFHNTLGDSVFVVVPSRYVAYVFPQLVTHYQDYYPMVFEAFRESSYPVSVEVLEFSPSGIRAVGVYDRP